MKWFRKKKHYDPIEKLNISYASLLELKSKLESREELYHHRLKQIKFSDIDNKAIKDYIDRKEQNTAMSHFGDRERPYRNITIKYFIGESPENIGGFKKNIIFLLSWFKKQWSKFCKLVNAPEEALMRKSASVRNEIISINKEIKNAEKLVKKSSINKCELENIKKNLDMADALSKDTKYEENTASYATLSDLSTAVSIDSSESSGKTDYEPKKGYSYTSSCFFNSKCKSLVEKCDQAVIDSQAAFKGAIDHLVSNNLSSK